MCQIKTLLVRDWDTVQGKEDLHLVRVEQNCFAKLLFSVCTQLFLLSVVFHFKLEFPIVLHCAAADFSTLHRSQGSGSICIYKSLYLSRKDGSRQQGILGKKVIDS